MSKDKRPVTFELPGTYTLNPSSFSIGVKVLSSEELCITSSVNALELDKLPIDLQLKFYYTLNGLVTLLTENLHVVQALGKEDLYLNSDVSEQKELDKQDRSISKMLGLDAVKEYKDNVVSFSFDVDKKP